MEIKEAVAALSALAQDTRLAVFRLLVREGSGGLSAGEVAASLGVTPATLSFHLAQLEHAGLLCRGARAVRSSTRSIWRAPAACSPS